MPNNIDVSNDFYHDSLDLLAKYKACYFNEVIDFQSVKSKRMKCFIDLRMAIESALKSYAAYYLHSDVKGKKLVKKIEGYKHYVENIYVKCAEHLPTDQQEICKDYCLQLKELPIGLRYRLDGMDFLYAREELYYQTIGNESWLDGLEKLVDVLVKNIGQTLSTHFEVIDGSSLTFDELFSQSYNKYAEQN